MSGRKSRNKGRGAEREIVNRHKALGIAARRRQAPGLADTPDDPDVLIAGLLTAEVKRYASATGRWGTVKDWMEGHDLLFMREDHGEWLVTMPWDWYVALLTCWHESGCPTGFVPDYLAAGGPAPCSASRRRRRE